MEEIKEDYTCDDAENAIATAKSVAFQRLSRILEDGKDYLISFQTSGYTEWGEEYTGICVIQYAEQGMNNVRD